MNAEEFKRCLPAKIRGSVNDSIREQLNDCLSDPDTREFISQNILGYTNVLQQGKFKLESYLNAIRYTTYKTMGDTNSLAYKKTFPEKVTDMINRGMPNKDINSIISVYNKSKLVTLIYESMMIPTHILNQDVFQEAINSLREIMLDDNVKPLVRVQAGKSLLDTLKPPEIKKMEVDISVKESDTIAQLEKTTQKLAQLQLEQLSRGSSLKDILNQEIVEVEYEEC